MARYRTKPVEIEAEQWFPGNGAKGVMGDNPNMLCVCVFVGMPGNQPHVHTIHNNQLVLLEPGDFIVQEPDRIHYYPVKPDVFNNKYEEV